MFTVPFYLCSKAKRFRKFLKGELPFRDGSLPLHSRAGCSDCVRVCVSVLVKESTWFFLGGCSCTGDPGPSSGKR